MCTILHADCSLGKTFIFLQKSPPLFPSLWFLLSPRASMLRRSIGGRSTRSICLVLACLSLSLNILLALFCFSVLQTACVLPPSSSSPLDDPGSSSRQRQPSVSDGNSVYNAEWEKEPTRAEMATKGIREVDPRGSKLEALFSHPLYNMPRPETQEDDWLLQVKTTEDEEERDSADGEVEDSDWWVEINK